MTYDVVMPQLGITMTEGCVAQWLKVAGDAIEKGEPLFIVQTDKVDMEIESPGKGFVRELLVKEEVTVPVGTVIARVGDFVAAVQLVSPRARRVAQELGVDLKGLKGTGELGRVRESDVRAAASGNPVDPSAMVARRKIAERMEESVRSVPQFSLRREVDASALTSVRDQLTAVFRLSFTDFLLKALGVALKETPGMNAFWRKDRVESRSEIHVGFAAQSPTRLLVPVIKDVDRLSIFDLARRRSEIAGRARDGKLDPGEMHGACCTLSNLGAFGVDEFDAIINPPESCILAAGRIAVRPFVVNGELVVRPTLRLTLTVDHRVADGVLAAGFLNAVAKVIEQPVLLLV
jgi:pyruvate dehydrogenase E2 component (dihydrolipoamide acetyltransferase)